MAPNKRGAPPKAASDVADGGVISKAEVEARGAGTAEDRDTYDFTKPWASEKRVFFTGLMFFTRLPCPGWCDHHPAYLMRSLQWAPAIGTIVGVWAAVWLTAAAVLWPPKVAVAASTLATVWLTGCFHEDGLADCFDGFGGGWGRAQILRIMKDSRVGTYALVGMSLVLAMKLHCLEVLELRDSAGSYTAAGALIAAHTLSRWTALPLIYCCEYLQDDEDAKKGLYNWFAQSRRLLLPPRLLLGTVTAVGVPLLLLEWEQAVGMYAAVVGVTLAAGFYGTAVIGGVVGDFLGATIQVAELACYLVLSADWSAAKERWQPLAMLAMVAAVPVVYCRRIIDFKASAC